jgi:hypothetical protein
MKLRLSLSLWKYMFDHQYAERVGISWASSGGDDEEVEKYYDLGYKPKEAVLDQIRKYDLEDIH